MSNNGPTTPKIKKKEYDEQLYELRVELVKLQRQIIQDNRKIVVLFEGRDAAGKDGTIRRIVKNLNPRQVQVVALGKPSDREQSGWYFQRYVPHLPAAQNMVLFNRSWYNRAGVEKVMGFCTQAEYEEFMEEVPLFEQMLVNSGIHLVKYYLDIGREEQKERIEARRDSPLKRWKISPMDDKAIELWDEYSLARDQMLARTHTAIAPWTVVRADNKRVARLNIIKDLLVHLNYEGKREDLLIVDPEVVFSYQDAYLKNGMIAH